MLLVSVQVQFNWLHSMLRLQVDFIYRHGARQHLQEKLQSVLRKQHHVGLPIGSACLNLPRNFSLRGRHRQGNIPAVQSTQHAAPAAEAPNIAKHVGLTPSGSASCPSDLRSRTRRSRTSPAACPARAPRGPRLSLASDPCRPHRTIRVSTRAPHRHSKRTSRAAAAAAARTGTSRGSSRSTRRTRCGRRACTG